MVEDASTRNVLTLLVLHETVRGVGTDGELDEFETKFGERIQVLKLGDGGFQGEVWHRWMLRQNDLTWFYAIHDLVDGVGPFGTVCAGARLITPASALNSGVAIPAAPPQNARDEFPRQNPGSYRAHRAGQCAGAVYNLFSQQNAAARIAPTFFAEANHAMRDAQ